MEDNSIYKHSGIVRTDIYCHDCTKQFIGSLDYDVNGNHEIECPYCGHLHYRVIKDGVITSDRFSSDCRTTKTKTNRGMWKHDSQPVQTSTVSHFLRDRWMNRSDAW